MKLAKLLGLFVGAFSLLTLTSCSNDSDDDTEMSYVVSEAQLLSDYSAYNIGEISWSTERTYQIGTFSATAKSRSQSQTITAWYKVSGGKAKREMDSQDLGATIPSEIEEAFNATKYSNRDLWIVEEVELEHNYNDNGVGSYYEVELQSVSNANLEAELFFDKSTGELLYSKEELDSDGDDDRFVINDQLKAAVEAAVPGATIIDAEIEDNIIEVEAIITSEGVTKEIELEFSMSYELLSSEEESEFLYSALPAKFDLIKSWFAENSTIAPMPNTNTVVEITAGVQFEDDYSIGDYFYEVEIDDYRNGGVEYEVEFFLDKDMGIIAVIVNDVKQP